LGLNTSYDNMYMCAMGIDLALSTISDCIM
jgi:hypothetical protein